MKRTLPLLSPLVFAAFVGLAPAQHSHDALAQARHKAKAENQRVLLLLNGGNSDHGKDLLQALRNYGKLGKLLKYEYQLAALPADSVAGKALRTRLDLGKLALPALAVLDTKNKLLGTLSSEQMVADDALASNRVRSFLDRHKCEPVHARKVLSTGLALAKRSKRHVFVYLSAPW